MKKLYIVAAHEHKGKSGIIRCLSGKYRSGHWNISNGLDNERFHVHIPALQEKHKMPEDYLFDIEHFDNALFALRIEGMKYYDQFFPNGQTYLDFFEKNNCQIAGLSVIGESTNPFTQNAQVIPQAWWDLSANGLANLVRTNWNWI